MSDAHGVARDQLRAFIERIERLEEEKKTIADDIKDVYGEAKGTGFDTKILRKVIQIRKQDRDERAEQEAILDSYLAALGMIAQPDFFDEEPRQSVPASREERRRQLMSEDMAVHKNLVDEMADAGLISEEARHENKALADAVATKFGNGPAMAPQSPREAAEAVAEMPRNILSDEAEQAEPEAAAEVAGNDLREPVAAEQDQIIREGDAPRETDRFGGDASCPDTDQPEQANETVGGFPVAAAPTNAEETGGVDADKIEYPKPRQEKETIAAPHSDQLLTGGDHEEVDDHRRAMGEGEASAALPIKPKYVLRPHCLNPGPTCGGHGSNHCGTCKRAMAEKSEVAA